MNNKCIYAGSDDVSQDQRIRFISDTDKLKEYIVGKMDLQDADSVIKDICAKLSLTSEQLEYLLKINSLKIPTKKLNQDEFIDYINKTYFITDIDQLLECIVYSGVEFENDFDKKIINHILWVATYKKFIKTEFIEYLECLAENEQALERESLGIYLNIRYKITNIDELKSYLKLIYKVDNLNDMLSTSKELKDMKVTEEKLSLMLEIYPHPFWSISYTDFPKPVDLIRNIAYNRISDRDIIRIASYLFNKDEFQSHFKNPFQKPFILHPSIMNIETSKTESLKEFFKQRPIYDIYLIDILDCMPHNYNETSIEEIYDKLAQNILDKYILDIDQLKRYIVDKMDLQDADSVIKDICTKLSLDSATLKLYLSSNALKIPTELLSQDQLIDYIDKTYDITDY